MFSSRATESPSKVNVPSRRSRNQPANRIYDIEFATEIGTSLISQVRNLQFALADKEEALKATTLERSNLEIEADGLRQRLRSLDESEQRYKDENWTLETQTHELMAAAREAADREKRLNQSLNVANAERTTALKELDELKQLNGKISEEHTAFLKQHDIELSSMRRNIMAGESEKDALQRKVEELTSQNQELARAVAARMRADEPDNATEPEEDDAGMGGDWSTPEHSPPPSPIKATPRHSGLESETLKTSLHHAHRMIQTLKGNIHREKSEKLELKRMLQDARDELETRRSDAGLTPRESNAAKRRRATADKDGFKKPPRPNLLGGDRPNKHEIFMDDPSWEDHNEEVVPGRTAQVVTALAPAESATEDSEAFETANEREETATDAFETGAESLAGESSDEQTETETTSTRRRPTREAPSPRTLFSKFGQRDSYASTASTSGDEDQGREFRAAMQPQQRYRLKINRGANFRRSKNNSDVALFENGPFGMRDSPASLLSNPSESTPKDQSLFAELGDLNGPESDEEVGSLGGTPSRPGLYSRSSTAGSRRNILGQSPTPSLPMPLPMKPVMLDAATMTEAPPAPTAPTADVAATTRGASPRPKIRTADQGTNTIEQPTEEVHEAVPGVALAISSIQSLEVEPTSHDEAATNTRMRFALALSPMQSLEVEPVEPSVTTTFKSSATQAGEDFAVHDKLAVLSGSAQPMLLAFSPMAEQVVIPTTSDAHDLAQDGVATEDVFYSTPRESVSETPKHHDMSTMTEEGTREELHNALVVPELLSFSAIESQATEPIAPVLPTRDNELLPSTKELWAPERSKPGFLSSVFGWGSVRTDAPPIIAEDETSQTPDESVSTPAEPSKVPFKDISNNVGPRILDKENPTVKEKMPTVEMADQSSQTMLSSSQIDDIISQTRSKRSNSFGDQAGPPSPSRLTKSLYRAQETYPTTGRSRARISEQGLPRGDTSPSKTARRPGSITSIRSSYSNHPPLPPDHREAIAAAAQKSDQTTGLMGPPPAPASAYRNSNTVLRPRTPTTQAQNSPGSKAGTTPRARPSATRSEVSSSMTRRSSVSSFASELDQRFNIRTDGSRLPYGLDGPGTDPRMIQAITQTMIGEYLWKYTRKTGRGEMSSTRHRRFFWVHPYSRTLYWSDQDPSIARRAEQRGKSVAIDAVRGVADDNPMPPGLHRKSLVVITPGRVVKFTATTGQRHETWFNALSYLLLRSGAENSLQGYDESVHNQNLTTEDVNEFNPSLGSHRPVDASFSTYGSRATQNPSPSRGIGQITSRSRTGAPGVAGTASSKMSKGARQGSISRISQMLRPAAGFRGSFSSRRSRHSLASAYAAGEAHASVEDLEQVAEHREQGVDGLENVRACCDGKWHISTACETFLSTSY